MNKNTKQNCKLMTARKKKLWTLFIEVIGRKSFSEAEYEQQYQVLHFQHSCSYKKERLGLGTRNESDWRI